jgi:hypothetical protein
MIDEEISTVLRHFRPKPRFITSFISNQNVLLQHRQKKRSQTQMFDRAFSNIKYNASAHKLIMSYLHVKPNNAMPPVCAYLKFEICVSSKVVKCIGCSASDKLVSDMILGKIDKLLAENNPTSSLFSATSRLLQILNSDLMKLDLRCRVGKQDTLSSLIKRKSKFAHASPTQSFVHATHLVDLQVLLLRCAAAGRMRSQTLAPVPLEFLSMEIDIDTLTNLIFNTTYELYICGFQHENIRAQENQNPELWTLLSFILSLPINEYRLSKTSANEVKAHKTKSALKSISSKLTIEISGDDPTPTFTKYASKYGTIQAYHGTKIESTWSILNYGLQNLSYNQALSQNGAIMGEGIYLSSLREVAEGFAIMAAERQPKSLSYAFEHESLLRLLSFANVDITELDSLDTYDIKCLSVFEATIINPPRDDKDIDEITTRKQGKYYIVTDSEFVHVTKLHLTLELTKKVDMWCWLPNQPSIVILVLFVALFWAFC